MFGILLIGLVLLLIAVFFATKKDIISPSFIFVMSFVFSSFWALAYYDEWKLSSFSDKTTYVLLGGTILFSIVSIIVSRCFGAFRKHQNNKDSIKEIKISNMVKISCLAFSILTVAICLYSICRVTHYSIANISAALAYYDHVNKFSSDSLSIGKIPLVMKLISTSMVYWYLYVLINNFLVKKKIDWLMVLIVVFGLIASMTTGGRNGAMNALLSTPSVMLVLTRGKKFLREKKKVLRVIVIVCALFLVLFPKMTNLLGRTNTATDQYYLAIYCGAEIKNLDLYLNEYDTQIKSKKNNMTFYYVNNWLGPKLGYTENYKFDIPFRRVGKYTLGNVATTFYSFIYDFGYFGMVLLTIIMAIISQVIYEKALAAKRMNKPSLFVLAYGYIFSALALSFFSNKFYEEIFNPAFIWMIILWLIFNRCFVLSKKGKNEEKIIA